MEHICGLYVQMAALDVNAWKLPNVSNLTFGMYSKLRQECIPAEAGMYSKLRQELLTLFLGPFGKVLSYNLIRTLVPNMAQQFHQ